MHLPFARCSSAVVVPPPGPNIYFTGASVGRLWRGLAAAPPSVPRRAAATALLPPATTRCSLCGTWRWRGLEEERKGIGEEPMRAQGLASGGRGGGRGICSSQPRKVRMGIGERVEDGD